MYTALSYLPTALLPSQTPFARYVKEHILDPLGLTSTTYSFEIANATGRLANGMVKQIVREGTGSPSVIFRSIPFWAPSGGEDGNGKLNIVVYFTPSKLLPAYSGAAGLISSAADMVGIHEICPIDYRECGF
jgi:CubicO group peptidase (beta-lactamase class C family)